MSFSKKLEVAKWLVTIVLIALVAIGSYMDKDMNALAGMACASVFSNGAGDAFYFWKSKNENRAKYAQQFVNKFAEDYGIDAAIRIAEVVLKD